MPFFDNKQLIHIAAESIMLVIILFYFSYQNKKLYSGLNICTKRLKEQEIILQNHDKILKNHEMILRNLVQGKNMQSIPVKSPEKSPKKSPEKSPKKSPEKVVIPSKEKPIIEIVEDEIAEELNELKVKKDIRKEDKNDK